MGLHWKFLRCPIFNFNYYNIITISYTSFWSHLFIPMCLKLFKTPCLKHLVFKMCGKVQPTFLPYPAWNQKNISRKPREVGKLRTTPSPPLQGITSVEVFVWEFEILLNFICKCLRKVSAARCEINFLMRSVCGRSWCNGDYGDRGCLAVFGMEMIVKVGFGSLKVRTYFQIITTICKKSTVRNLGIKELQILWVG